MPSATLRFAKYRLLRKIPRYCFCSAVFLACEMTQAFAQSGISLNRHYVPGETLHYFMEAENQNHGRTVSYRAQADGQVAKDSRGVFYVDFKWSRLSYNGHPVPLPSSGPSVQEQISLDPRFRLSIPNFSKIPRTLIAPMADLLTFYADVQLAMRQDRLRRAGDRVYLARSKPNSWADHVHTLVGEDAVDFDIVLANVNAAKKAATLVVRHIPPPKSEIRLPAQWMHIPVADAENNWVQVVKDGADYLAEVGKETFTDRIVLSLRNGEILSGTMDNPVQVLQKQCSDKSLQSCGNTQRYWIRRHIEIKLDPH